MVLRLRDYIWGGVCLLALILGYPALKWATGYFYTSAYPIHYRQYVTQYSQEYGVDEKLVYAVIRTESGFDPNAVSQVGASGLMQITESTFEWAAYRMGREGEDSYDQILDPAFNIQYGTFILSLLLEEFGNAETALCAYHAGWGNVKDWLANPEYSSDGVTVDHIPFWDTRSYVPKVMGTLTRYQELYP